MRLVVFSKRLNALIVALKGQIVAVSLSGATIRSYESGVVSTEAQVHVVSIDPEEKYLLAAFDNKTLVCWSLESGERLGSRQLRKKATAIQCNYFSADSESQHKCAALVSDKAGDIWAVRVPDLQRASIVAGHTASVVTDLLMVTTGTQKTTVVVSADRDEKLRFSVFPDLETILGYGLKHSNVVSSLCNVGDKVVSSSWDHSLCLWQLPAGTLLHSTAQKENSTDKKVIVESTDANADGDELPEKSYDEKEAGNYPFKVASNGLDTCVVLYKDECHADIFRIDNDQLVKSESITLSAAPLDVAFLDEHRVVILSASPVILSVFSVHKGSLAKDVSAEVLSNESLSALKDIAGESFDQSVISKGLGFDAETGMKKHLLDRPFNEEEHINLNAKKGSKRSKKN